MLTYYLINFGFPINSSVESGESELRQDMEKLTDKFNNREVNNNSVSCQPNVVVSEKEPLYDSNSGSRVQLQASFHHTYFRCLSCSMTLRPPQVTCVMSDDNPVTWQDFDSQTVVPSIVVYPPSNETTTKSYTSRTSDKSISAHSKEIESLANAASVSTDL
uniref:Uncharacterized protein n=1 Tax=Glossina austeni TaxID=7395 RepID=A0A1A9VN71_GLOAU